MDQGRSRFECLANPAERIDVGAKAIRRRSSASEACFGGVSTVSRRASVPHAGGMGDHDVGGSLQLLPVKCRLNQGATAAVMFSLRGEKSGAEQPGHAAQSICFDVLVVVVHEHRFNEVRVFDEEGRPACERKRRDIAR